VTEYEILLAAKEAGFPDYSAKFEWLERFAALVAAHVTEALTKAHEDAFQSYVDQAKADRELSVLAAVLAEREACAKLVEEMIASVMIKSMPLRDIVAAIRARGNNAS
jgi:hypothetical protein